MKIRIATSPRVLGRALAFAVTALTLASLGGSFSVHFLSVENVLWREARESFFRLFYLDGEANIPTWFASSLLLCCSAMLGLIAAAKTREADRFARHWTVLSILFLGLSLDEAALIHEMAIRPLRPFFHGSGLLYYTWVVPGAVGVCFFAAAYFRFLIHLPLKTRMLFAISGAIYVGGAIGVEAITGQHAARFGEGDLTYEMLAAIEELTEMAGIGAFIYTLVDYAGRHVREVTLSFNVADAPGAPER